MLATCGTVALTASCLNTEGGQESDSDHSNDASANPQLTDTDGHQIAIDDCPAAKRKYKPVDFHNTWTTDVTIRIYEYRLVCPHVFQDPSAVAWGMGSTGDDPDAHLLLPQGSYSICIDWWEEDELDEEAERAYLYKLYGSLPDDPFFSLNENSDEVVPLLKTVEAGPPVDGTGRCPDPINMTPESPVNDEPPGVDTSGGRETDTASTSGVAMRYIGTYNYYLEIEMTDPQYFKEVVCDHDGPAEIVANTDGTLTVTFGDADRDDLCAAPLMSPPGTHLNGRFTIPLGELTITGTLDSSALKGSGALTEDESMATTHVVFSLDLARQ